MVLSSRVREVCECKECNLIQIPQCILDVFDEELVLSGENRRLYVSLGQFSIIRLERRVMLLIPAYDFCIPNKECIGATDDNPCDLFDRISFPVEELFPPEKCEFEENDNSCGC